MKLGNHWIWIAGRAEAGDADQAADLTHAKDCRHSTTESTMMTCKTGAEHIKSLKDGRTVYIDGKLVADVTEHPAFRNSVKSAAALYDFQAEPENIELMTFVPNGSNRRVNR